MSDDTNLWQPGPRLSGRVDPSHRRPESPAGRDPRWLAAAILIAASAIACSLWVAALWLQSSMDSDDEPEAQDESALSTVLTVDLDPSAVSRA